MNRRDFIKLLSASAAAYSYDLDKLLWVPGQKKIFIPSKLSISQIVEAELARIVPHIQNLFERDDIFYQTLTNGKVQIASSNLDIPFEIVPNRYGFEEVRQADQANKISES